MWDAQGEKGRAWYWEKHLENLFTWWRTQLPPLGSARFSFACPFSFLVFLRFCLHFDSAILRSHKQNKGKRAEAQEKVRNRSWGEKSKVGKYITNIYSWPYTCSAGNLMSCAAFEVASLRWSNWMESKIDR